MSALSLVRPVVSLDFETTSPIAAVARIVQVGCVKLMPDGTTRKWTTLVNPGEPIPPESTKLHRITDADVAGLPGFDSVGPRLLAAVEGCDFCGYNLRFDLEVLGFECQRHNLKLDLEGRVVLDAMVIYHHFEPRDLTAAVRKYLGEELRGAHGAVADAEAALHVLQAQLLAHPELPANVHELGAWVAARRLHARRPPAFPPFGPAASMPVKGAKEEHLRFYEAALSRGLDDPSKAQWRARNLELLEAIRAEKERAA